MNTVARLEEENRIVPLSYSPPPPLHPDFPLLDADISLSGKLSRWRFASPSSIFHYWETYFTVIKVTPLLRFSPPSLSLSLSVHLSSSLSFSVRLKISSFCGCIVLISFSKGFFFLLFMRKKWIMGLYGSFFFIWKVGKQGLIIVKYRLERIQCFSLLDKSCRINKYGIYFR